MQKPDNLIPFDWQDYTLHTEQNNKHLAPTMDGQFIPANFGQRHSLLQIDEWNPNLPEWDYCSNEKKPLPLQLS